MLPKNREEALELWKNEMGEKEYAYDFSGKKIKRSDYLEKTKLAGLSLIFALWRKGEKTISAMSLSCITAPSRNGIFNTPNSRLTA